MNTIGVPIDALLEIRELARTSGENSKARIGEIVKGILEKNLKELEAEAIFK